MPPRYEPKSDFLKAVFAEKEPLSGSEAAEGNLQRLIALMGDSDESNRDWATFLLASEEIDTQLFAKFCFSQQKTSPK